MAIAAIILFKIMVAQLGLKITGLWSFLSSITTITSFGSFGFANALLFYIPKYQVEHDECKVKTLINTSFFSVSMFTLALCAIAFVIFNYIIPFTVEKDLVNDANRLLPFIILSFFFSALSTTFLSVLDGLMLMHLRAKINIIGSAIFLIFGYILLPRLGIIAIPVAQVIQNLFLLIVPYLVVKKQLSYYRLFPGFNKEVFTEIFRYGFNFQLISLTQIISEPFMKAMITKFSGSHTTAIFDFCLKLLSVFRSLIISANQTIVPQITLLKTQGKLNRIKTYYKANLSLVLSLSLLFFLSPLALMDSISLFFLNERNNEFNFILCNISLGLLINAIAFPAHFYYLGTGNLRWNVINNAVTACLIFISAPLLGILVGGKLIVMSWSASAIIGSCLLIYAFNRQNNSSLLSFFNKNIIQLIVCLMLAIALNLYLNHFFLVGRSYMRILFANIAVLLLFVLYPVLNSQIFKKMVKRTGLGNSR